MRDQREHVETAVDERRPAAHEERPAAPEHDRRRQRELDPDAAPAQRRRRAAEPGIISAIASTSSGTVRARQTQNRRVMSIELGVRVRRRPWTVSGSSAMPQIGHAPGPSRTISGCIGQVYRVPAGAVAVGADTANVGFRTTRPSCPAAGAVAVYRAGSALNRSRQPRLQK